MPAPSPGPRPSTARRVPRLHVITDVYLQQRWSHADLARLAALGGADAVQLRDKQATDDELASQARAMLGLGASLIVDDRVDLARHVGARGAHVGADDLPPAEARARLGPSALLGATVNDHAMLDALRGAPIDYIGVGPVYPTRSKGRAAPVLGLEGLARIAAASPWPVIAIGGVDARRAPEVLQAGAWGIAALAAVALAADPAAATASLREAIDGAAR